MSNNLENYEEKYNQALKRAKEFMTNKGVSPNADAFKTAKELTETIFPELRESEDERIRKEIISFITDRKNWFPKEETKASWIAWLEKQGEQEHIDESKPKFNVGDWITNGEYTWKVIDIKPLDYILQSQNGDVVDDTISYVDEEFHLWTIQDAKDGDVLAAHECLVLFKKLDGLNIKCYCTYHFMNNPSFYVDTLQNKDAFHPATKEQCDTLKKAMTDAGYTFDFENKELKKVEQKPTPKYKIGDCIEYRGEKYKITNVTVTANNFYYGVSLIKEPYDWGEVVAAIGMAAEEKMFKIEQKSSWSEEDEEMIDFMIEFIESLYWRKDLTKRKDEVLSWLKSIKSNHWKPSEKQMEAIKFCCANFEEYDALKSLYNDLKGLNLC